MTISRFGRQGIIALSSVFLLLTGLVFAGCESSGGTDPKETFAVSFSPNPVTYSNASAWEYRVTLRETSGVGVRITGFSTEHYYESDVLASSNAYTSEKFELWFTDCGGEGNYVAGGETRCTDVISSGLPSSGYIIWTFEGVNDLEEGVIGEGRLELL